MYLTHYTEYPIFEPAEGGYYYAGAAADDALEITDCSGETSSAILDAAAEYLGDKLDGYRRGEHGFYNDGNGNIGSGDFWLLEVEYGAHERGKVAYC